MIFFGHLGLGLQISKPFMGHGPKALPVKWVLLGTLFPDLLDKSLYYGLSWITDLRGAELGAISGSRTIGHAGAFLLLCFFLGWITRSRPLTALSLGIATHLLVDHVGDAFGYALWPEYFPDKEYSGWRLSDLRGLLWPLMGSQFPITPFAGAHEHLASFRRPYLWIGEFLGLVFLLKDQRIRDRLWKRAYSPPRSKSS